MTDHRPRYTVDEPPFAVQVVIAICWAALLPALLFAAAALCPVVQQ